MSEHAPENRLFARRRRANVEGGRQHHHKVKVTPEEEGMLLRLAEAQHVTIPRLLVESALAALVVDRPESVQHSSVRALAVPNGHDDCVAFVALNTFKVLDEESLVVRLGEE